METEEADESSAPRSGNDPKSELGPLLQSLGPGRLQAMGLPSWAPVVVDRVVWIAKLMTDSGDSRHWTEKLDAALTADEVQDLAVFVAALDDGWVAKQLDGLTGQSKHRFWNKLLGQAMFDRLKVAFAEDARAVLGATRSGLVQLRPLAVALQDALSVLPPAEAERSGFPNTAAGSLLAELVRADEYLDFVCAQLEARQFLFDSPVLEGASKDVSGLLDGLRRNLTAESASRLGTVDAALERKMKGAGDALNFSADGASQAANSLVEVIDRLLRQSVDNAEVLRWVADDYPGGQKDLTYRPNGSTRLAPTKRAQLLFYLYNGRKMAKVEPFIETLVSAFLSAREILQQIKHADSDYDDAVVEVEAAMRSLAGSLTIVMRLRALTSGPDSLDGISETLAS